MPNSKRIQGFFRIGKIIRFGIQNRHPALSLTREGLRDVCKLSRQGQLCTSRQ